MTTKVCIATREPAPVLTPTTTREAAPVTRDPAPVLTPATHLWTKQVRHHDVITGADGLTW